MDQEVEVERGREGGREEARGIRERRGGEMEKTERSLNKKKKD